jgi:hypothetical protein
MGHRNAKRGMAAYVDGVEFKNVPQKSGENVENSFEVEHGLHFVGWPYIKFAVSENVRWKLIQRFDLLISFPSASSALFHLTLKPS